MAKRERNSKIKKWLEEGRGTGSGKDYKPWLRIQDVSSKGRSTRLRGNKTERQHEFLSDLERNYFYILEFNDQVIDIREQYPLLPLEETLVIANELGIKHPKDPKTNKPIVMTTDFLVKVEQKNGVFHLARTIKMKDELLKERVLEKFEIEREYWRRKGTDWGIVTEREIPKVMAKNISYVHDYYDIREYDVFTNMDASYIEDLAMSLLGNFLDNEQSIRKISSEFDQDKHLPAGSGVTLLYYLIARKIVHIDMSKPINLEESMPILAIKESELKRVKFG